METGKMRRVRERGGAEGADIAERGMGVVELLEKCFV